jgi:hypothetical protein
VAELLIVLSALIGASAFYPYIKSTISGAVRPQLVTWSIWTVLSGVLTISLLQQGAVASAALSAQALIGCGLVVAFGWRRGHVRLTRLDILCLIGAIAGISALIVMRDPVVTIFVAVAVDAIAFIPTFRHAWANPEEESALAFSLSATAATLALVVAIMHHGNFDAVLYPLYSVLFNGATAIIILFNRQPSHNTYAENEI